MGIRIEKHRVVCPGGEGTTAHGVKFHLLNSEGRNSLVESAKRSKSDVTKSPH